MTTVDLKTFGATETSNFSEKYVSPTNKILKVENYRRNPNNRKVCFVTFEQEDLKTLVSLFDQKKKITPQDIGENEFAVYLHQMNF